MEDVMKFTRITTLTTVAAAALALGALAATPTLAQMKSDGMKSNMKSEQTVTVGGAPMYPSKNIIQNAVTRRTTPRSSPP